MEWSPVRLRIGIECMLAHEAEVADVRSKLVNSHALGALVAPLVGS